MDEQKTLAWEGCGGVVPGQSEVLAGVGVIRGPVGTQRLPKMGKVGRGVPHRAAQHLRYPHGRPNRFVKLLEHLMNAQGAAKRRLAEIVFFERGEGEKKSGVFGTSRQRVWFFRLTTSSVVGIAQRESC